MPEVPTAAGDSRISSITKEARCKELCDYASRRLFVTRASGAAQEKQLGEQKTFNNASRWGTIASSDRTRRWTCSVRGQHKHGRSRETPQQQQAPPDMRTGQSAQACLRREVPTDHEARSHTHAAGTAAGGTSADHTRESFGGIATRGAKAVTRRFRADECTIAEAKPKERCRTKFPYRTSRLAQRRTKVDHTWHGGNHDHADGEVAN